MHADDAESMLWVANLEVESSQPVMVCNHLFWLHLYVSSTEYDITSFAGSAAGRRHDRFVSGKEMQGARVLIDNHIVTLIKNAAWKFSTPARPHPVLFRVSGLHTLSNRIVLPSPRHAKQAIAEPLPWKCGEA